MKGLQEIQRLRLQENAYVYRCRLEGGRQVVVAFCDDHIGQNHDQPMGEVKTQIPLRASVAQVTQIISRIGQTQPDVTREEVKKRSPGDTADGVSRLY